MNPKPWLHAVQGARGRRLTLSAIKIQSAVRGMRARRVLARARWAATRIQASWRGGRGRACAQEVRRDRAATRIQAAYRMHAARRAYLEVVRWVSVLSLSGLRSPRGVSRSTSWGVRCLKQSSDSGQGMG